MWQGGPSTPQSVVCEVCETPQLPASLCAECGMPLKVPAGVPLVGDPPVEQLLGLEQTGYEAVAEIPMAPPPGIEATIEERVPDVPFQYVPGFEPTAQELLDILGDEDVALPELERTAETFERTTPAPSLNPANCPYCGFVQASGRVCNNCGRSRIRFLPPQPIRAAIDPDDLPLVRCRSCGSQVKQRELCSECGTPMPTDG